MGLLPAEAAHSGVYLDAREFESLGTFDPDDNVMLTADENQAYLSVGGTPTYYGVLFTNAGTTNWVFTFSSFRLKNLYSLELSLSSGNRGRPVYFLSKSSMSIEGYVGASGGGGADEVLGGEGAGDSSWTGGAGGNYDMATEAQAGAGPGGASGGGYPGDQTTGSAGGGGANGGTGGAGGGMSGSTAGGAAYGNLRDKVTGGSGGGGGSYYYHPSTGYWDDPDPEDEDPGNWIEGDPATWQNGSGGGGGGGAVAFGALGSLSVSGSIVANGASGGGLNGRGGAGGGGGGGAILVYAYDVNVSGGVTALGGTGGASSDGDDYKGGGGGGGLIGIYALSSVQAGGYIDVTGGSGYETGGDGVMEAELDSNVPAIVSTITCDVLPSAGPHAGGNVVVITNCVPDIGDGADVTNVTFDGVAALSISGQGANWVAVVAPPAMSSTPVDIGIDSTTRGSNLRLDCYLYHPAGSIFGGQSTNDYGRWTETVGLPGERQYGGAAALNGQLYVVGGMGGGAFRSNVYRFSEIGWTEVSGLPVPLAFNAVAEFNGAIYSVGGNNSSGATNGVYRFDGTAWTEVAPLPAVRMVGQAAVRDGALYYIGGHDGTTLSPNVYRYDGTNWSEDVALPFGLTEHAAAVLNNEIYVIGGMREGVPYLTNVFRFDGTGWEGVAAQPVGRYEMAAVAYDDAIWTVGGHDGATKTNVYRFNGEVWGQRVGTPADFAGAMVAVFSNVIYSAGGYDSDGGVFTNVYRYPGEAVGIGVRPFSGSMAGGFTVAITGTNLCDGTLGDVTGVTLAGVAATVTGVNGSTQIVVTANATGAGATGDVVVVSAGYGETVRSNAFSYVGTTRVVLLDFGLRVENGQVAVCWQTASEEDTVGFDVYRWDGTGWVKLNGALIPATGEMGGSYGVVDAAANAADTFRYKLVETETDGDAQVYGPFDVAVWNLRLNNVAATADGVTIRWLGRAQDTYEILKSVDLQQGFDSLATGIPGVEPVTSYTDRDAAGNAFYRIRAE